MTTMNEHIWNMYKTKQRKITETSSIYFRRFRIASIHIKNIRYLGIEHLFHLPRESTCPAYVRNVFSLYLQWRKLSS